MSSQSTSSSVINRILVVVAMAHEAMPIVSALNLQPLDKNKYNVSLPISGHYSVTSEGTEILLLINGSRKVNNLDGSKRTFPNGDPVSVEGVSPVSAALTVWEGIKTFKPQLVINAGTAGGVRAKGAVKGTVYLVNSPVKYHDRLINFRLPGDTFETNNYQAYGIGSYLPSSITSKLVSALGMPGGSVSTGSSFDQSQGNIAEQFDINNVFLKDMEAAAVGEVCQLLETDVVFVKGVTDYIDPEATVTETHSEQFKKELEPVSVIIAKSVAKVINHCAGKYPNKL
eukprot:TRINITY_DN1974_c0_g1_i1.p1 TRINITY_DN1974_c0_g1~~TRINITY_DN1974_c0_g1_i1.p1  ORF type:complete len:285 (-),score=49.55 TRINITY_DN1974_c0_g1_i1:66-920(-)